MKGIELSRRYYKEYGEPMLKERFAEVFELLCIGLVGEGSECFGFDDITSTDHDFEPAFCIFYPEDLIDSKTVFNLERAYAKLPNEFMGYKRQKISPVGGSRHGVISIGEFYLNKVGKKEGLTTVLEWLKTPSSYLAEATNGEIFFDGLGRFTNIRNNLLNMPYDVALKKAAGHLLLAAQAGQYNFVRCRSHGENGAAVLSADEFVRHATSSILLLLGLHEPYYKWSLKLLRQNKKDLADMLEEVLLLSDLDEKQKRIEETANAIIKFIIANTEIKKGGDYLEEYAYKLNDLISDNSLRTENILFAV